MLVEYVWLNTKNYTKHGGKVLPEASGFILTATAEHL